MLFGLSCRKIMVIVIIVFVFTGGAFGQEPSGEIGFSVYAGNPVLETGSRAEWDEGSVTNPEVVFFDGLYHMFYLGTTSAHTHAAIGYATSEDGLVWQKYASNPVLEADGAGFDTVTLHWPVVLVDGDTWLLYFSGQDKFGGTLLIGRATAQAPSGPWTKDESPVLMVGKAEAWDSGAVYPISVHKTDEGYMMFYAGGNKWWEGQTGIGLATSSNGITWTKYDDPDTTEPAFADSDPVLRIGFEDWQMDSLWGGDVLQTDNGWEMFYSEKGHPPDKQAMKYYIGCATSDDAIYWVKCAANPLVSPEDDPMFFLAGLFADLVVVSDSTYMLYYDYQWTAGARGGISVAIGTASDD